ncbi:MAG: metF [Micavibrio sp.]|nr:metF [Micavibrio sp.]
MTDRPKISLEFFPPKTDAGKAHFWEQVDKLSILKPAFMTVTYGAGGSTRDWTIDTAAEMQRRTGINTAAHLTCVNTMKDGIAEIAHKLWDSGVRHIVALRGDIPAADAPLVYSDSSYYHYANELVDGLKGLHDFEISVAAYPEKHPDAADLDSDIAFLKRKCDAGADRAITQFFFDNKNFYTFRDRAIAAGITTPIIPGLLPISDFNRVCKVAGTCQASIPDWLRAKFENIQDADEVRRIGHELLVEQIRDLCSHGVDHLHFYTLNRADLTIDACQAAGITP